jgi:hypothetical protein
LPPASLRAILDSMRLGIAVLTAMALLAPLRARADELKLKDGTKIVGTIVGFEENSFRVKTSYGFAVVQKDQVASINISEGKNEAKNEGKNDVKSDGEKPAPVAKPDPAPVAAAKPIEAAKTSTASSSPAAPPSPAALPPAKPPSPPEKPASEIKPAPAQPVPVAKTAKPETPAAPALAQPVKLAQKTAAAATEPVLTSASASVSGPKPAEPARAVPPPAAEPALKSTSVSASAPKPAEPPKAAPPPAAELGPIREQVVGNTYTNQTYGFQMYKPPTWQVIAGVPSLLPGAIAAMGTNDQTTYLLVGQELAANSVESVRDATERRLRDIMDNFRPLGEMSLTVSGARAIQIHFRGGVDGHDWSGVAMFVPHGARLFTIFGMTLADSDLVQIQENVIARAISSLQFTAQ